MTVCCVVEVTSQVSALYTQLTTTRRDVVYPSEISLCDEWIIKTMSRSCSILSFYDRGPRNNKRLRVLSVKLSDTSGGAKKAQPNPPPLPTTYAEPIENNRARSAYEAAQTVVSHLKKKSQNAGFSFDDAFQLGVMLENTTLAPGERCSHGHEWLKGPTLQGTDDQHASCIAGAAWNVATKVVKRNKTPPVPEKDFTLSEATLYIEQLRADAASWQ
eukprot:1840288-Pyramimonas_sp.AAC.2